MLLWLDFIHPQDVLEVIKILAKEGDPSGPKIGDEWFGPPEALVRCISRHDCHISPISSLFFRDLLFAPIWTALLFGGNISLAGF